MFKSAAAQILHDSAEAIRTLSQQLKEAQAKCELSDKVASDIRQQVEVEKLAHDMHAKGLHTDVPHQHLVAELEKQASLGRLDVVREAVDLVGPNMLMSPSNYDSGSSESAESRFEQFLQS